jgi:hypothetical protein
MLEAAFYASGGEKIGPFDFEWPTPKKLAQFERRRQRERKRKRGPRTISADARRKKNARLAYRYATSPERRARMAAYTAACHTAHRLEISERESRRRDRAQEKANREATRLHEGLIAGTLAQIERPLYTVIGAHGSRRTEAWPLRDAAAEWLAAQEAAQDTKTGVLKKEDTSATSCYKDTAGRDPDSASHEGLWQYVIASAR